MLLFLNLLKGLLQTWFETISGSKRSVEEENFLRKMAEGRAFCTLITLLNILHLIETASTNSRTERYAG